MTSPSNATFRVPAAGPSSITAVKTNVSEIEIDAYDEGSRTGRRSAYERERGKNEPLVANRLGVHLENRTADNHESSADDRPEVRSSDFEKPRLDTIWPLYISARTSPKR